MTSIALLHMAVRRSKWPLKYILELPILQYIGKISYGVYIFHFLVREIDLHSKSPDERFLVLSIQSLGLASLSWHTFEYPINSLKCHFPYLGKRST